MILTCRCAGCPGVGSGVPDLCGGDGGGRAAGAAQVLKGVGPAYGAQHRLLDVPIHALKHVPPAYKGKTLLAPIWTV